MTMLSNPPDTDHRESPHDTPEVQSLVAAWYAGTVGRREFIARATATLGSLSAATVLLASCTDAGSVATTTPAAPTPAAASPTAASAASAVTGSPVTTGSPTVTRAASAVTGSPVTTGSPTATRAASVVTGSPVATTAATATGAPSAVTGSPVVATGTSPVATATRVAGSPGAGSPVAAASPGAGMGMPAPPAMVSAAQAATRVPATMVNARMVMFPNGSASVMAYEARPQMGSGPLPAIIVVHENMGLTEHIQDVARRCAKEGFIGLGMDYLSREGGTMAFSTPQDVTAGINRLTDEQIISDSNAAVQYLKANGATKIGVVGFCWGGRNSLLVALRAMGIDAAVSYYGGGLPMTSATRTVNVLDEIRTIKVPVMGNYGAMDPSIPLDVVDMLRANVMASGQPVDVKAFDGTGHAFNNDTRPSMGAVGYNAASAMEAWGRTIGWFRRYLA